MLTRPERAQLQLKLRPIKDKLDQFLRSFDSPEAFIAYCRGNGIHGVRHDMRACLVAVALQQQASIPELIVRVGRAVVLQWHSPHGTTMVRCALPPVLQPVLCRFDAGQYPDLIEPPAPRR
jgi:hypothetical protein